MGILLNVQNIEFRNELGDNWWIKTNFLKEIFQCIEQSGLMRYINYFNYNDKLIKVNSVKEIIEQINRIKTKRDIFSLHSEENIKRSIMDFKLRPDFFGFRIIIPEHYMKDNKNVINQLLELFLSIYRDLRFLTIFGDDMKIWLLDFEYPKIKPSRNKKFLGSTAVVNIIHQEYFEKNPHLKFDGFEKLFTEKLPEGATREMIDDLCIIKWCDNVNDSEQLEKIFMERESWIYKTFKLPIDSNFNEDGDELMFALSQLPQSNNRDSFFTFYDPIGNTGFKPIVLNENNYLDPEIEATLKRYLERGSLENGDPLEKIVLILPSRKYVMEIYEKVKKIGVYKVIYTDNNGILWNPFPVGNWRE